MTAFSEMIGWYAFLAAVIYASLFTSKSFLHLVLDRGKAGEQVYFADTLIAASLYLWKLAKATVFASACTAGVVIAILTLTDASLFSAFGYGSITFFVGNFVTPKFMSKAAVDPATVSAPAVIPVSRSEPPHTGPDSDSLT